MPEQKSLKAKPNGFQAFVGTRVVSTIPVLKQALPEDKRPLLRIVPGLRRADLVLFHAYPIRANYFADCSLFSRLRVQANGEFIIGYENIRSSHHVDTSAALGLKRHNLLTFAVMIVFLRNMGFQPDSNLFIKEPAFAYGFIKLPEVIAWLMCLILVVMIVIIWILFAYKDKMKLITALAL